LIRTDAAGSPFETMARLVGSSASAGISYVALRYVFIPSGEVTLISSASGSRVPSVLMTSKRPPRTVVCTHDTVSSKKSAAVAAA
jgi:hypothetical protein